MLEPGEEAKVELDMVLPLDAGGDAQGAAGAVALIITAVRHHDA